MTTFRLVAASMLCSTLFLSAQEPPKPGGEKPPAATPAKPAPVYVVAKAGDKLEVMTKEELEKKNKQLADEYTKAMTQYEKDKKEADAAHKKFEGKEPKKTVIEAVGEHPTKEAAEAALKKIHDEKAKGEEKGKDPKKDEKKKDK